MPHETKPDGQMRICEPGHFAQILAIINVAAQAYRGVIPDDRWHDPYMSQEQLKSEIEDGVVFSGYEIEDRLVGVMGVQSRRNVDLIRHAYVYPDWQGLGIGSQLLSHLTSSTERPVLIGTWAAAHWAIRFYERHGFRLVGEEDIRPLLRSYWNIPERQIETSVILASSALSAGDAQRLIDGSKVDYGLDTT